ncbi:LOW QUALITY PROTEIN: solute carrier family 2, facilitated glucose transporter member 5-like [Puma concolor]|uniref:Solute carrier family 2, facilitated glucose transporter member 5 n=1 Tax=Puma concolor TaxID=9696 RepID=A0A6P6GYA9_PUMCO|nr:LOW QUALITY PROTEIN: solute carrier family 2, facilitated glucose transporter member 5-like [Puma concolor]
MEQVPAKKEGRLTLVLGLATLIAAFGSSFQYGYNVAAINSPAQFMKTFYNKTYYERNNGYMDEFALTLLWSVSVSMFPFGGFVGSLMVGPLVNNFGRKGTLLFNNIFSIVPAVLMGCSKVAGSFEMIILSRLLVGICAGLSSNVVPMYLGELAPKNLRGGLGVVPQLFITIGILVAQIFGLRSLLASEEGWPILLGVTGVPAALQLYYYPSREPRYLLIQKKKRASNCPNGHLVIIVLMGDSSCPEGVSDAGRGQGWAGALRRWGPEHPAPASEVPSDLLLTADQIYLHAGMREENDVQYVTVGTRRLMLMSVPHEQAGTQLPRKRGFWEMVFVGWWSSWGRRFLLLLGFSVCFTACCVLTAANLLTEDTISWMPYVSISLHRHRLNWDCTPMGPLSAQPRSQETPRSGPDASGSPSRASGPMAGLLPERQLLPFPLPPQGPIPAVLILRTFLQSSRPALHGGGSVGWEKASGEGEPHLPFPQVGLGAYSFIIFGVICLLTTIYTFLVVPETKAKTFIEINQIFTKMNKVSEVHPEKEELEEFPPSTRGQ